MKSSAALFWTMAAFAAIGVFISFAPNIVIYRVWAFKCENTASEMGYTVWFGTVRSDRWHTNSALETFMRAKYPSEITNRWVSYAGTGKNYRGKSILFGHGRPALVLVKLEQMNAYVAKLSDADKRRLYDFLATGDREAVKKKTEEIWNVWANDSSDL